MLTVIYVYEPATVTIEASDPRDERATVRRYDRRVPPRTIRDAAAAPLERGIYAILSRGALQVRGTGGHIEHATLSKDTWPDPPAIEDGASREQIRMFLNELVKGGDVD